VAEASDGAVLASRLESQDSEGLGDYHLLHLVVGGGHALEHLEPLQCGGAAGRLVGDHAADGLVEDSGRGSEVERTWGAVSGPDREAGSGVGLTASRGIVASHLPEVGVVLDCIPASAPARALW
jgi:hypothetical protein